MLRNLVITVAAMMAVPAMAATEVVVNGNFSQGNTGFTSDYDYRAPGNYGAALAEGLYAIDTNAINTHPAWGSFGDNTGDGAGLYFIANGAGFNSVAWQQTVSVNLGRYEFSAFAANLCCNANQAPPNFSELSLQADAGNGFVTLANFTLSGVGTWLPVAGEFVSTTPGSLTLRIVNTNTVAGGNDFALDDISFRAVPEPQSWALLIAGFGLVGAAMRRRRLAAA